MESEHGQPGERVGTLGLPHMLYPTIYAWILLLASLDVILTGVILEFGGSEGFDPDLEINPVARLVIQAWGMHGALIFKFSLILLVIVMCEVVGRAQPRTGVRLGLVAVLISASPVVWSLYLLLTRGELLFG